MYNQQMMGQPMVSGMMIQGMMQGGMMMPQPMFKQINIGRGIDMNEYNKIVQAATSCYMQKTMALSLNTSTSIKQLLGGEWFVYISQEYDRDFDFALTSVAGGDFMSFTLDSTLFQVCRLK